MSASAATASASGTGSNEPGSLPRYKCAICGLSYQNEKSRVRHENEKHEAPKRQRKNASNPKKKQADQPIRSAKYCKKKRRWKTVAWQSPWRWRLPRGWFAESGNMHQQVICDCVRQTPSFESDFEHGLLCAQPNFPLDADAQVIQRFRAALTRFLSKSQVEQNEVFAQFDHRARVEALARFERIPRRRFFTKVLADNTEKMIEAEVLFRQQDAERRRKNRFLQTVWHCTLTKENRVVYGEPNSHPYRVECLIIRTPAGGRGLGRSLRNT
ncbi:hypothetical protein BDK51DRAFT_28829 [Blyttiomyces helicus]|uniref:C2H2-type domain-containing protein n=1 Tax=Blyttiomyces helicus TaxID=388810 RepID=A0A4P9WI52_9FUNG|nr:hypothetical protein BDK51DRAFT_28829 [Blyttiomyces helicus]|eukprot:RKO92539.1 hypothetical protein BDK51DRAFT_28829 [Blyttiomyces helicus]